MSERSERRSVWGCVSPLESGPRRGMMIIMSRLNGALALIVVTTPHSTSFTGCLVPRYLLYTRRYQCIAMILNLVLRILSFFTNLAYLNTIGDSLKISI